MIIYGLNTETGIVPLYPSDLDEKKRLKLGKVYKFKVDNPRNYEFLKKFMALIRFGQEHSKRVEMPFNTYRKYATIKAGFGEVYQTPKGVFVDAKSIAFDKMQEEEFQEVYSRVLDFIILDTEADEQTIKQELINFM